jgi:hypothetical protein
LTNNYLQIFALSNNYGQVEKEKKRKRKKEKEKNRK